MSEPRSTAVAIPVEAPSSPVASVIQDTKIFLGRVGTWAGDTAQQFGVLVAVLMGPAVFSAYAFAVWSLAGDVGWTDSFVFQTGALSNWFIWLGVAISVHLAASVLKRHTRLE